MAAVWQNILSFNSAVTYNAQSFVPGSEVTQKFENQLADYPTNQGLLSYVHTGTDVVSASKNDVTSPAYMRVISVRKDAVTMQMVGMDREVTLRHLTPSELKNLDVGYMFSPGEKIASYPTSQFGTSGGENPHVHVEEVGLFEGVPRFLDPMTHEMGTRVDYPMKIERIIDRHKERTTISDESVVAAWR
jgi:hypothetical protein